MHLECHAMLGWVIGNLFSVDRKQRNYAVIGAVLPDIDAIPYVFGDYYYGLYHHTFGHNVFLWVAFSWFGLKYFRTWKAAWLGFAAFGSHIVTDAYMSAWYLYLFWPVSHQGFLPKHSLELRSPVNTWLLYTIPLQVAVAAWLWKRTPLEWISPKLDTLFLSFFQRKTDACSDCGHPANVACEQCGKAICPRHVNVRKGWRLICPSCR